MKKTYKKALGTLALALCLMTVLTLFVSCNNKQDPNAPEGYVTASADCADYQLFVPDDWTVDTVENSLMASARANTYSSTPNITMMPCEDADGEYESIEAYWATYQSSLERIFDTVKDEQGNEVSSFAMSSDAVTLKVGGKDAVKYSYTATLAGVELQYVQVIIKKSSTFYVLTYTASAESYDDEARAVLDGIIANVVFEE